MMRHLLFCYLLLFGLSAYAQQPTPTNPEPARQVDLSNVDIAPNAVDTKGWLLLDKDIQTELEGAIQNLYNFKYDKSEKQFRSLRRRYPNHPMPYFLLGLNTWWKIMPTNITTEQYDKTFFAYMDTAITKAERQYGQDSRNYEACFFLSAAYGFDARLNAERHNWRKATLSSKRALDYLEKSQEPTASAPSLCLGRRSSTTTPFGFRITIRYSNLCCCFSRRVTASWAYNSCVA